MDAPTEAPQGVVDGTLWMVDDRSLWSPTFSAPKTDFVEDIFSIDLWGGGWGDSLGMILIRNKQPRSLIRVVHIRVCILI